MGCANNYVMEQTEEGELPFDKLPVGTEDVQLFEDMHSPLLSGGKFVNNRCKLVFDKLNAHIIRGATGDKIQTIIEAAEQEDSDNSVMTVPYDEQTNTWTTDANGQTQPAFNIVRYKSVGNYLNFIHNHSHCDLNIQDCGPKRCRYLERYKRDGNRSNFIHNHFHYDLNLHLKRDTQ